MDLVVYMHAWLISALFVASQTAALVLSFGFMCLFRWTSNDPLCYCSVATVLKCFSIFVLKAAYISLAMLVNLPLLNPDMIVTIASLWFRQYWSVRHEMQCTIQVDNLPFMFSIEVHWSLSNCIRERVLKGLCLPSHYPQTLSITKKCTSANSLAAGMRTFTWKVSKVNKSHQSSQMSQRVHLHSYDVPRAGENTFIFPSHPCSELHVTLNRLFGWDDEMLAQVKEREKV